MAEAPNHEQGNFLEKTQLLFRMFEPGRNR
jgi:hypothetical protein